MKALSQPARGSGRGALGSRVREDRVRAAALEVLAAVRAEGQLADRALARVLRRERDLWSGERRAAADAVYAVLRQERMLDAILSAALRDLGRGTLEGLPATRADLLRLAAAAGLDGTPAQPDELARAVADRARDLRERLLAAVADPWERIALDASLPGWLIARLGERLGPAETAALAASLNRRAPLTIRANPLKATPAELARRLKSEGVEASPCHASPWGLTLDGRTNAFALASFREGLFEVQDEGSQIIARLCGEKPGRLVVDGCAGAGGKTLALAAAMGNRGELWALDSREDRLEMLRPRARRAGVHNVRTAPIGEDGPLPAPLDRLRERADVLLVDAPCSGVGALRRNPDARRRLSEAEIEEHARRQLAILRRLAPLVRPGGRLVYATCSLLWDENEVVVAAFLPESGFSTLPWREASGPALAEALDAPLRGGSAALQSSEGLRLWPHRHGSDGFFAAVLVRDQ